jgi:hypothetical protein
LSRSRTGLAAGNTAGAVAGVLARHPTATSEKRRASIKHHPRARVGANVSGHPDIPTIAIRPYGYRAISVLVFNDAEDTVRLGPAQGP